MMQQIVSSGYCIGCGACQVVDEGIEIVLNSQGMYQARLESASEKGLALAEKVCPFSNKGPHEDEIGAEMFGNACQKDIRIGYYRSLFIGYVAEGDFREKATSGGLISWICSELLQQGLADRVLHVKKCDRANDGRLFKYGVSTTPEGVMVGAKSRYYPVEMSEVLRVIREVPGNYVVVGLPCFIKAVRRLMRIDPVYQERIKYSIGLVCGHLKSAAFADSFAWEAGIEPGALEDIDFRVKQSDAPASNYAMYLQGGGYKLVRPTREFLGANWGHNFFRYEACDYCDDVFAETADIAIGDAWLPQYDQDPKGTSVVIVRNERLHDLIENARSEGRLCLADSEADEVACSQSGGLRDRRQGLAYRLFLKKKKKMWVPNKRVCPGTSGVSYTRRKIYRHRMLMREASHQFWGEAVFSSSYDVFECGMRKLITKNNKIYKSPISRAGRLLKKTADLFS
ncbi:Coenzyme F420 hydrogenase/dehydrogenase, beta subunit C-terminal domain [Pontiella sulfatireligans]|uniref:Coenzyme F420 hydrogenase n=1 Tax=Pontiella sulfatireligans TaxID=2750658 RepID=A0A6C2UQY9_9BACT|nr:Coenzyme F420 hydrogenase/dehydrogenase, beta subunit C-terminal domain [Pontiella sulfatireligans]VGO21681.1 hypothetical protein SCARR_03755 [Pontiella sulfatireligans]